MVVKQSHEVFSSLRFVTQEFVVNFHQARDELLAPWQSGKLVPFWRNFVSNPQLGGVPGPANYCIAIYVHIHMYIYIYTCIDIGQWYTSLIAEQATKLRMEQHWIKHSIHQSSTLGAQTQAHLE